MRRKPIGRTNFSFVPVACCPYCGSALFKKDGVANGRQRLRCKGCGRTFNALTGTMLAKTRKGEEKWEDYVVQFTNDATLIAEHEYGAINKNTAHLWRLKMMRCLGALVSEAVLSGHVWIDEIYFDVPKNDKVSGPGWRLLRGISRNKVAVEAAIDEYGNTYAAVMGTGKPTSEMISEALAGHISPGSVIVHDKFHGHGDFIRESGLADISGGSQEPGYLELMQRANQFSALIKRVFVLHVGIGRAHIQDYLNWACMRQRLRAVKPGKKEEIPPLPLRFYRG
jgi:transposase-like protein